MTPLHEASRDASKLKVIQLLIAHSNDVNCKDNFGDTSLHIACELASRHQVAQLLQNGADVNTINDLGCCPLHVASDAENSTETVKVIVNNGANV